MWVFRPYLEESLDETYFRQAQNLHNIKWISKLYSNFWTNFQAAGASRRYLNAGWLVSSFVFLDEIDVSHNVLYVDQPDLALPRQFYLDTESYADYITAYKTFMHETAVVMAR